MLAASCAHENNNVTRLSCTFGSSAPDSVTITIGEKWDTTVAVKGKSLKVNLPVNTTGAAFVQAGDEPLHFVSDGSRINVDMASGKVTSDNPDGITSRMLEFYDWESEFSSQAQSRLAALEGDERDAAMDELLDQYDSHLLEVAGKNSDNILGLIALSGMSQQDGTKMLEALNSLSDEMKEKPYVQEMLDMFDAKANTAPGKMFADFEVPQEDGTIVRLSDYVGHGKYILVDFWASWCGPCKAEVPNLKKVYDKYHSKKFDLVSIAVMDSPADSKSTAKALGMNWNLVFNAKTEPLDKYGVNGIPFIILFGPDGSIVARDLRGAEIGEAVAKAVAGK